MESGEEEPRSTSVSSLASRFEQLASSTSSSIASSNASYNSKPYLVSSSKNSSATSLHASAPPSSGPPPVKRPKPVTSRSFPLQVQAAQLEAAAEERHHASSETASPTEPTFKSGVSSSRPALPPVPARPPAVQQHQQTQTQQQHVHEHHPVAVAPVNARHLEDTAERLAPPPIPHATRPAAPASSTPSFAYSLSSPQSSTSDVSTSTRPTHKLPPSSPKCSRTPPPVPASRRSRPGTPSTTSYTDVPTSPTSSMAVEVDMPATSHTHHSITGAVTSTVSSGVSSGVNAIASRFGHAKPSKSYTSPASASTLPSRRTSPESKVTASRHLGNPFDPHTASRALQDAMSDVSSATSKHAPVYLHSTHPSPSRPLSVRDSSSANSRTATPPPVVPRHTRNAHEAPSHGDPTARSVPVPSRTSPLPPVLPSRDRSNSLQRNDNPFTESSSSSVPPLPSRGAQDSPGRPRAATSVEALSRARTAEPPVPPRRDTIPIPSASHNSYIPPPPPVRNLQNGEARSAPVTASNRTLGAHGHQFSHNVGTGTLDSSSSSSEEEAGDDKKITTEMPDASFANRRPPTITPERRLYSKHSVSAFAIHGRYAVSATTHLRIWDTWTGETTGVITLQGEHKVVAVEFVFTDDERGKDGRIAWAGTKDGNLFEIDIQAQRVLETKLNAHSSPISVIYRAAGNKVVTVCESGKVQIWSNEADPGAAPTLSSIPQTQRLGDKHCYLKCFGEQLWSCHGPTQQSTLSSHLSSKATRSPTIRVYDVGGAQGAGALTTRAMHTLDNGCPVGQVMAGTMIPCEPNLVYLAHETGHISKWDRTTLECIDVVRVSPYAITALEGVNDMLWAGNREGTLYVYDTRHSPWKVAKAWKAADEPICGLQVDLATLGTSDMLHVASYGRENLIMWDGLLEVDWLEHSMLKREPEFSSYRDIKVFIFSWNIDSSKPADLQNDAQSVNCLSDALHSSLHGVGQREDPPEVVVFGLQEVVDLENKKLTAKNMILGRKKADAMFQDQVSHQYMRWHDRLVQAVRTSMPADSPYYLLHAENLVGLQSLIFVKSSEKPNISDVAKISVKTGMGGRYGNKGAILARFVIDDSSICFLNCHLAAGQRATRQRNKDLVNILENKAAFLHPSGALPGVYIGGNGQTVFEHEICFLSGDLNYRVSLTRSIVTANIRSNNLKLLLDHDQLAKEMKTNQAFRLRSFREADINFLPTYKFDPGTDNYDSSAKERIPAWCDRILYRVHEPSLNSEKIRPIEYRSWSATPSDHKPISGLYSVRIKRMDREQRQKIRDEMEVAWVARANDVLIDAKRFHGLVQ